MLPLKEDLEKRFGSPFPVGTGTAKRDDPLVITERLDYVSIEYAVAEFLLQQMGFEYEFEKQALRQYEGQAIDELVYATRMPGASEWTHTRRFFFDITAGFQRDTQRISEEKLTTTSSVIAESTGTSTRRPYGAGQFLYSSLRWIAFLPLAYIAAWLLTRAAMHLIPIAMSRNTSPLVPLFFTQILSGSTIGFVGVKVAPSAKTFALVCCVFLSALVSITYFLKFNDLLGGLAAATGLIATVVAGYSAIDDD